jgi:hypothetical protein
MTITDSASLPPLVRETDSILTPANRRDHFLARWGYKRSEHRVEAGLYALGDPTPASPVFVTANYTLSFDALRSSLRGTDGYLLVLDTEGINVWCAAGKKTFGTDELVHRIQATRLEDVVEHRRLILPQLGAPGISAQEVKRCSGFKVDFGPVRAKDLPTYMKTGEATPEMRQVRFDLGDRIVLIPVELVQVLLPMLVAAIVLFFAAGPLAAASAIIAVLAGAVLFPVLLPWIPTSAFSTKGFLLGGVAAIPFAVTAFMTNTSTVWWDRLGWPLVYLLTMPPVAAFLALNFTGASTFTSRSWVKREIFTYVPIMAIMIGAGLLIVVTLSLIRLLGGTG